MSNEDVIRESVTFRYNLAKAKTKFLEKSVQEISQIVKLKNPSLNLQIEKILKNISGSHNCGLKKENRVLMSNFIKFVMKRQRKS